MFKRKSFGHNMNMSITEQADMINRHLQKMAGRLSQSEVRVKGRLVTIHMAGSGELRKIELLHEATPAEICTDIEEQMRRFTTMLQSKNPKIQHMLDDALNGVPVLKAWIEAQAGKAEFKTRKTKTLLSQSVLKVTDSRQQIRISSDLSLNSFQVAWQAAEATSSEVVVLAFEEAYAKLFQLLIENYQRLVNGLGDSQLGEEVIFVRESSNVSGQVTAQATFYS
jgi:hypothetical protein